MLAGALVTYGITSLLLSHPGRLTSAERLDIGCFEFLGWWWIVYFTLSYPKGEREPGRFTVFTLRSYLDGISSHRGPMVRHSRNGLEESQHEDLIREKARSSRDVQGILIAVVVLTLTLVVIDSTSPSAHLTEYQRVLRAPIFAISLVIILAWMLTLDVYDTIQNSFQVSSREAYRLRRWFYRDFGPLTRIPTKVGVLSGAVSYGYLGHALLPIFALMVFSWFEPAIIGFGTALYVFLAYPYHYGYWAIMSEPDSVPKPVVKARELVEDTERKDIGDDHAVVFARWVINRDGDAATRLVSGDVPRGCDERPNPRLWPQLSLGFLFLILSILFA